MIYGTQPLVFIPQLPRRVEGKVHLVGLIDQTSTLIIKKVTMKMMKLRMSLLRAGGKQFALLQKIVGYSLRSGTGQLIQMPSLRTFSSSRLFSLL